MLNNLKKGIANYLLIIGFLGIVVTFFLIAILQTAYQQDPQECENLAFKIDVCSGNNRFEITVNNQEDFSLNLEINGKIDISNYLTPANEVKTINLAQREVDSKIEIIPLVMTSTGSYGACQLKKDVRQENTIGRC